MNDFKQQDHLLFRSNVEGHEHMALLLHKIRTVRLRHRTLKTDQNKTLHPWKAHTLEKRHTVHPFLIPKKLRLLP
jgi:hypothetical protein